MNIFPTDTSTRIPVVKIYTDGTDGHNQINKDFYDNAQIWRNRYNLNGDAKAGDLYINDEIIYGYNYCFDIFNDRIDLYCFVNNERQDILNINPDGSVSIIPTNTTTFTHTPTTTVAPTTIVAPTTTTTLFLGAKLIFM